MRRRWPNVTVLELWCIVVVVSAEHAIRSRPARNPLIVPGRPEDFGR